MTDRPPSSLNPRGGGLRTDVSVGGPGAAVGAEGVPSPWMSPLGRWLRGVIDDSSSLLPSLGSVIETARRELTSTPTLGVLFVRFEQWGYATRLYGWRELQRVYEAGSTIAVDMVGDGLRQLDVPADLGLHGEGFAILLSAPREAGEIQLEVVEAVAGRVAALAHERLTQSLPPELMERVTVQVGAGLVRYPHDSATLEDALVGGLVQAEQSARDRQTEALAEVGERLSEVIEQGRITALFQPVVDVELGKIWAFDAIPQGPSYLNLQPGDVLLDVAGRAGLRQRAIDVYHHVALDAAEDAVAGAELLILRATAGELLETAVRLMSLLYRRSTARITPANILFLVDGAEVAEHFPAGLSSWHSVAEMGFRLGVDVSPDRPLPLEHLRELSADAIRVSGRAVRDIHRRQDEFEHLLMLSRFAARHGMHVLAADCSDRREYSALRRAGVSYVQGDFVAPCFSTPARPELALP